MSNKAHFLDEEDEFGEYGERRLIGIESRTDSYSYLDADSSNHTSQSENEEENGICSRM